MCERSSCLLVRLVCSVWVWSVTFLWSKQTAVLSEHVSLPPMLHAVIFVHQEFSFLRFISFLSICLLVVFCFAWTDKKLDHFQASESIFQHAEWGNLISVCVRLCAFIKLMQTKNLNCNDADLGENEPGKTLWHHQGFGISVRCFLEC